MSEDKTETTEESVAESLMTPEVEDLIEELNAGETAALNPDDETTESAEAEDQTEETTDEVVDESADESEAAGDDTGDEGGLSSDTIALGESYGFTKEALAAFPTEEAANAAIDHAARQAVGHAQQQQQPQKQETPADEESKEVSDIAERLREDGYDESLVSMFEKLQQDTESQRAEIEQLKSASQQKQQSDAQERLKQDIDSFDDIIADGMDEELFGVGSHREMSIPREQMSNRVQLKQSVDTLRQVLYMQGMPVPPEKALVEQAYRMTFSDHIIDKSKREMSEKVRKQSQQRTGGRHAPKKTSSLTHKHVGLPEEDPFLLEKFAELSAGNS